MLQNEPARQIIVTYLTVDTHGLGQIEKEEIMTGERVGYRFNKENEPPYIAAWSGDETLVVPLERLVHMRMNKA